MLAHNVPWQEALYIGFIGEAAFVAGMLLSVISGYFDWWVLFTVLFLAGGFLIMVQLIPLLLGMSRASFVLVASNFKERQLKDWVPAPQPGSIFHYDKQREEWSEVTPDTKLPENTFVVQADRDKE